MAKKSNKEKLKDRKDKVKTNKYYRKYVDRLADNPPIVTAIYCKGCGVQIKGLRNNILTPYWNYTEITIEFDDSSAHMTPMCRKCAKTENKEALEAMYIADLEEFEYEEEDDNKDKRIWDIYMGRKPQKIAEGVK